MYGHILYIIIYWCLRDCYMLLCFFFRFLFFETWKCVRKRKDS